MYESFKTVDLTQLREITVIMKSFVEYSSDCDFPIENLPYGVFSTKNNVSNMK